MSVQDVGKLSIEISMLLSTSGTLLYETFSRIPMGRRELTLVEMEALANVVQTVFVKLLSMKQENLSIARSYARKKLRRSRLLMRD